MKKEKSNKNSNKRSTSYALSCVSKTTFYVSSVLKKISIFAEHDDNFQKIESMCAGDIKKKEQKQNQKPFFFCPPTQESVQ